jgi:hypothetical protein
MGRHHDGKHHNCAEEKLITYRLPRAQDHLWSNKA